MNAYRLTSASILALAAIATIFPSPCRAQESASPDSPNVSTDLPACVDIKDFPRLPSSTMVSCDKGASIEVSMPLKPDARGYARERAVRGAYEFREYQLAQTDPQEQTFNTLLQLLPIDGFAVKFAASPSTITGRKEGAWILVTISGEYYDVKLVRVNEDPWNPVRTAGEIAREMGAHQRVAIYGIVFSADNQAVVGQNSPLLNEVLKFLDANLTLAIRVESHKMSLNGSAEDDLEITTKRARAVVDWLVARGVVAARLQPEALGRTKPITDNDTPIEVQRNERIELVVP